METVIVKLREDLRKFINDDNSSFVLNEILFGIVVLQYTFRMEPISIIEIIIGVVSGLYFADLGTGLIHILLDNYKGDNPTLKSAADGFQNHHKVGGQKIITIDNFTLLKEAKFMLLPVVCILYNMTPITSKSQMLCQIVTLYGMHFSQITHKYAHLGDYLTEEDKQKPEHKIIAFLQDNHLILRTEEHRIHHTSPKYDVNFCIVNGFANPLLNCILHIPFIHSWIFPDTA